MSLSERIGLCNQVAIMEVLQRIALPALATEDKRIIDKLADQVSCTRDLLRSTPVE